MQILYGSHYNSSVFQANTDPNQHQVKLLAQSRTAFKEHSGVTLWNDAFYCHFRTAKWLISKTKLQFVPCQVNMAIDCDTDFSRVSVKCWKWAENTQQKAWDLHGAASCFGTLHSVFLVQRKAWHELLCFLTWECARWLQQSEWLSHFMWQHVFLKKKKNTGTQPLKKWIRSKSALWLYT